MKKSRHSEEKIVSILREAQGGMKVKDVWGCKAGSVKGSLHTPRTLLGTA